MVDGRRIDHLFPAREGDVRDPDKTPRFVSSLPPNISATERRRWKEMAEGDDQTTAGTHPETTLAGPARRKMIFGRLSIERDGRRDQLCPRGAGGDRRRHRRTSPFHAYGVDRPSATPRPILDDRYRARVSGDVQGTAGFADTHDNDDGGRGASEGIPDRNLTNRSSVIAK